MASNYLRNKVAELSLKNKEIEQIKKICKKVEIKSFKQGSILAPSKRSNINWIIEKYKAKLVPSDIELNLRKKKLFEAEKAKKELESKLQTVKDSISHLKNSTLPNTKKLNLKSSENRQEYYESERQKTEETSKAIRKYSKQQRSLEQSIQKNIKRIEKQLKMQQEEQKYNSQYEVFLRNERIKEEREKMLEKKKKRQEDQETLKKSQSQSSILKKPLFQIYEEKFNTEILMPELERRKEELKKKREIFQPIKSDRLKEHGEWYDSMKEKHREQFSKEQMLKMKEDKSREKGILENSWNIKAIEEKRHQQEVEQRKLADKREKMEKMKNYAEIAQEMYNPALEKEKTPKNSLKKAKKPLKNPKSEGESQDKPEWKPKKFKPNSCMPPKKKLLLPKIVDYLKERRQSRVSEPQNSKSQSRPDPIKSPLSDLTQHDLEKLKKNAMRLEELAHKKSLFLNNSPNNFSSIEQTQSVDDLLIGSIRAKLLVLNHLD